MSTSRDGKQFETMDKASPAVVPNKDSTTVAAAGVDKDNLPATVEVTKSPTKGGLKQSEAQEIVHRKIVGSDVTLHMLDRQLYIVAMDTWLPNVYQYSIDLSTPIPELVLFEKVKTPLKSTECFKSMHTCRCNKSLYYLAQTENQGRRFYRVVAQTGATKQSVSSVEYDAWRATVSHNTGHMFAPATKEQKVYELSEDGDLLYCINVASAIYGDFDHLELNMPPKNFIVYPGPGDRLFVKHNEKMNGVIVEHMSSVRIIGRNDDNADGPTCDDDGVVLNLGRRIAGIGNYSHGSAIPYALDRNSNGTRLTLLLLDRQLDTMARAVLHPLDPLSDYDMKQLKFTFFLDTVNKKVFIFTVERAAQITCYEMPFLIPDDK